MARAPWLLPLCLAACGAPEGERRLDDPPPPGDHDPTEYLFDPEVVHDFHLTIPPASWDAINAEAIPPGCVAHDREYYTGTLAFEDRVLAGVGIRTKGGCGSSRTLDGKPGLKVNLRWDDPDVPGCAPEQSLHGLRSLTFNNAVQDWTYVHERLGYPLYEAMGVPAPRIAHARLFINEEPYGLYVHMETINRQFLGRWFSNNDGMMYEAAYSCDLVPDIVPEDDSNDTCWRREFGSSACDPPAPDADPTDWSLLRQLTTDVVALDGDDFYPAIAEVLNFDAFLAAWAIESVIVHWDGYPFFIVNNYRVYRNPQSDRWTLLPAGIDQTFKDSIGPFDVQGLLAVRCLADADCEAAFVAAVYEAIEVFEDADLESRAEALYDLIHAHVIADPKRERSLEEFEAAYDELYTFIADRPAQVRQALADRGF